MLTIFLFSGEQLFALNGIMTVLLFRVETDKLQTENKKVLPHIVEYEVSNS